MTFKIYIAVGGNWRLEWETSDRDIAIQAVRDFEGQGFTVKVEHNGNHVNL